MRIKLLLTVLSLAASLPGVAQTPYQMAGPYEVVARDGEFRHTKVGSERDMRAAFDYAQKGDSASALFIIKAYAHHLQRLDGHDAPLCLIQCYDLVKAMTLLKCHQTVDWRNMVQRAILPTIQQFETNSPYANGNWGAIVNRCRMACAIFLQDSMLYKASIDYFLHGADNGSLPCYIGETGQCQETGRDQAHVQLGLQALAETCEMAWSQGDDLWGALDNRLLKGFEYTARYNLGYDVPFETWQDCTGLYCEWTEPGAMQRGRIRCIYDAAYEHYTTVKGLKMPYTKKILDLQRKAERRGEIIKNMEADQFVVKGVKGSLPIGEGGGRGLHKVFTYSAPEGAPLKHDYDVYVQPRGIKEWTKIETYMAKVNASIGNNRHAVNEISYAFFDFEGDVFVRVVTKNRKFRTVRVRPDYKGVIANVQNDSTIQFLLFQPENLSVEFDGDMASNLLLFTSKPPVSVAEARREAKREGRRFISYERGLYSQDTVRIGSNTTVYLAGGSYFTGTFAIEDAENVSILGRGIARPVSGYEGCHIYRSKNVLINGLILNTCPIGGSDSVTIHDTRSISYPAWGDGMNVFASSNVLYDRVFCRNSDDCTTAYATRKGFWGSTRNVHMKNSTLWADVAHPIFIGLHGNPVVGDTIENLVYENIDILCHAEPQVDYQGCMAINCGDNNLVRNITFNNIRVENILQGSLLQVKVGFNKKYCMAPGRGVEDIIFRNIRYNGECTGLSIINGYDESRTVRNVSFQGLKINGRQLYDDMPDKPRWYSTADYVPVMTGNHVGTVTFSR